MRAPVNNYDLMKDTRKPTTHTGFPTKFARQETQMPKVSKGLNVEACNPLGPNADQFARANSVRKEAPEKRDGYKRGKEFIL